ncbi:unnamed protein product [Pieris macdunnoughi]|uniref:Uncharacterized protein n=1 Tax=Pieris macdunnoughi TaxID=345717 RepID=A0A821UJR3_9NEOP|nr:unnamed protein product [Pieris macdunnoughi]
MDLGSFRSELVDTLWKYSTPVRRGRPTSSSMQEPPSKIRKGKPCQALPSLDVILDGVGHEQIRMPDRQRCSHHII